MKIPLMVWGEHGFMDLGGMHSYSDLVEFTYRYRHEHCLRGYEWSDMTDEGLAKLGRPELAEGLTAAELLEGAPREQAVWEAAGACLRGGLPLRAAETYRRWYELRPEVNARGLFEQGDCLRRAARSADALRILEEYLLNRLQAPLCFAGRWALCSTRL